MLLRSVLIAIASCALLCAPVCRAESASCKESQKMFGGFTLKKDEAKKYLVELWARKRPADLR